MKRQRLTLPMMQNRNTTQSDPSSFRDPSGVVFFHEGNVYRTVTEKYKPHYELAVSSGLYDALIQDKKLIPHIEVERKSENFPDAWKILSPKKVDFISYPYEWCFGQLKDAALLTLDIQKRALQKGMSLKDATAFNVQFVDGKPIFIDTLSFETYNEGAPWQGYRQFCEHFLAPLALMSYSDMRLSQLFRIFLNGVPLEIASSLLPFKTRLRPSLLSHIHLHAMGQRKYEHARKRPEVRISRHNLLALIDNLESVIRSLQSIDQQTEWGNYYEDTNYSDEGFEQKRTIIQEWLREMKPKTVWDLGANDGEFSYLASEMGIDTIAFDIDPVATEKNYCRIKKEQKKHILPLILDLTNPSVALGWAGKERKSLRERGPADMVFSLALIHHLAISNNVPLEMIAEYFGSLCRTLIIEFVPIDDSQVERLLTTRENIFKDYTEDSFEGAFTKVFSIAEKKKISSSKRTLYLMHKKA